jgi:hypothetical protein
MELQKLKDETDLNEDGIVSEKEYKIYEKKAINRRRIAWVSLIALILSGFYVMLFMPETRIEQLNGIIELFWITLGGIVGAYVGISSWVSRGQ